MAQGRGEENRDYNWSPRRVAIRPVHFRMSVVRPFRARTRSSEQVAPAPSTPAARSPSMPSCPREQATRVGYACRHGSRDVHPPADSGSWGEFIDQAAPSSETQISPTVCGCGSRLESAQVVEPRARVEAPIGFRVLLTA